MSWLPQTRKDTANRGLYRRIPQNPELGDEEEELETVGKVAATAEPLLRLPYRVRMRVCNLGDKS